MCNIYFQLWQLCVSLILNRSGMFTVQLRFALLGQIQFVYCADSSYCGWNVSARVSDLLKSFEIQLPASPPPSARVPGFASE